MYYVSYLDIAALTEEWAVERIIQLLDCACQEDAQAVTREWYLDEQLNEWKF